MDTCKDCIELTEDIIRKHGKKPIVKYRCRSRHKDKKPTDMACMLLNKKGAAISG